MFSVLNCIIYLHVTTSAMLFRLSIKTVIDMAYDISVCLDFDQ